MMDKLYELTGDLKVVEDKIREGGGELTDELEEALNASTLAVRDKATGIAFILRNLAADVDVCDKEIKRLQGRKRARENASRGLNGYAMGCMVNAGVMKIETPLGNLNVQKNPPSVEVVDKGKVPGEYMIIKQEEVIDKERAKKDLKAGKEIAGLRLITDKTYLRIR